MSKEQSYFTWWPTCVYDRISRSTRALRLRRVVFPGRCVP